MRGVKRQAARSAPSRNTRPRPSETIPPLSMLVFTSMESIKLEYCWTAAYQKEFKSAALFAFLRISQKLPALEIEWVEEYVKNYDLEDGSSSVQGQDIFIDEITLNKALYLPNGELTVPGEVAADFEPVNYFRTGNEAFEKAQGWKTAEALTPQLVEWLRFAQRRLVIGRHATYLSKKLLYPVILSLQGMEFNWAEFVASRIHSELEQKRKTGKITSLLCCNYISEVIRYCLSQPVQEQEKGKGKGLAVNSASAPGPVPTPTPVQTPVRENRVQNQSGEGPSSSKQPPPIPLKTRVTGTVKQRLKAGAQQLMEYIDELVEEEDKTQEMETLKAWVTKLNFQLSKAENKSKDDELKFKELEKKQSVILEKWARDKLQLKSLEAIEQQERERLKAEWDEERRRLNAMIKDQRDKIHDQASEKNTLLAEAENWKIKHKELTAVVETQGGIGNPVAVAKLEELEKTVEAREKRIEVLESQVRDLGAYNDELTAQLNPEEGDGDDSEATEDNTDVPDTANQANVELEANKEQEQEITLANLPAVEIE